MCSTAFSSTVHMERTRCLELTQNVDKLVSERLASTRHGAQDPLPPLSFLSHRSNSSTPCTLSWRRCAHRWQLWLWRETSWRRRETPCRPSSCTKRCVCVCVCVICICVFVCSWGNLYSSFQQLWNVALWLTQLMV